jgi:nucleoside-diphosphate-sugar epimerase
MRIAILGAGGFLGQNLIPKLINQGHEVTGFVLRPEQFKEKDFECRSVVQLLESSITGGPSYDISINLAARRSTKNQPLTESEVHEFTYDIPKDFILRTANSGSIVLNASTYIQNFGGHAGKTVDSYGAAKEKLSQFVKKESMLGRFRARDLSFFTLYGIGDRPNHLVPSLLRAAYTGEEILLSPGYQLMNLLYVDDAVENILRCVSGFTDEVYQNSYVWSDEYFTVRELVARTQLAIDRKIYTKWGGREYVGHEMMDPWPIPIEQIPSFSAPTNLEKGIRQIWQTIEKD